ncbi:MAG: hypothetical protein VX726_12335 [Planctomycetota bacterium]|nr:hypothetical protein [Planctomycetota bacterium]
MTEELEPRVAEAVDGPASDTTWPISWPELRDVKSVTRAVVCILVGAMLIGILLLGGLIWTGSTIRIPGLGWGTLLPYLIVPLLFIVIPGWQLLSCRRRARTWQDRDALRVWKSGGLVCPWCSADVGDEPCRHGIGPEHRALLVRHYVAEVTHQPEDGLALAAAVKHRRFDWRRLFRWRTKLGELRRQARDADTPPSRRARARRIVMAAEITWWLVVIAALRFIGGIPWILVTVGVLACASPWLQLQGYFGGLLLQRRCSRCKQQCPDLGQVRCHECGADLEAAGAIAYTRVKERSTSDRISVLATFGVAALALLSFPFLVKSLLPTAAQASVYSWTGTPTGYFQDLQVTGMSPEEARRQADLLIHEAATRPMGVLFDGDFLETVLAAGLVPESYRERAARATADADLEVVKGPSGWSAVVTPRLRRPVLDAPEPSVCVGRILVDGRPRGGPFPWRVGENNLSEFMRSSSAGRGDWVLPEERMVFEAPLDLQPGEHVIEARCWILLHGRTWQETEIEFDDEGRPVLPAESHAYELPLVQRIVVP